MTSTWTIREVTKNIDFRITLHTFTEEDCVTQIYTVGKGGKCIEIVHNSDTPESVELLGLGYYPDCITNRTMERRTDTIHFAKIALCFVVEKLKRDGYSILHVFLSDLSKIKYDNNTFDLSNYYFLLHQQTWYEKKMNAYPTRYIRIYDSYKKTLNEPIPDFRHFITTVFAENQQAYLTLLKGYNSTMSYRDFFNRCEMGILLTKLNEIYKYLQFRYSIFKQIEFMIDNETIEKWCGLYNLNTSLTITGGSRRTHSVKKRHQRKRHGGLILHPDDI